MDFALSTSAIPCGKLRELGVLSRSRFRSIYYSALKSVEVFPEKENFTLEGGEGEKGEVRIEIRCVRGLEEDLTADSDSARRELPESLYFYILYSPLHVATRGGEVWGGGGGVTPPPLL